MPSGYNNKEYSFVLWITGSYYNNGVWTDTQTSGTNTNGMFYVAIPENAPNGRYAIEVRAFTVDYFSGNDIHFIKLFLTNLPMTNGYYNATKQQSTLYGVFEVVQKNDKNVVHYIDNGDRPWTQQINGIPFLRNGQIGIKITMENGQTPITMEPDHTWTLALDFKKISD